MANQLGSPLVSPRCYAKHQRYRPFARVRQGANQFSAFLNAQATRLSTTSAAIFADLRKNTAQRVRTAANTGSLS